MLRVNYPQTVADHSYRVAMLVLIIADRLNLSEKKTYELVIQALLHDIEESVLGDVQYYIKHIPEVEKALDEYKRKFASQIPILNDEDEDKIVKIADMLDLLLYTEDELRSGNVHPDIIQLRERAQRILNELTSDDSELKEIVFDIYSQFRNQPTYPGPGK